MQSRPEIPMMLESRIHHDGRDFFHIHRQVTTLRAFASSRAPCVLTHAKARRREVLMFVHYPSDAIPARDPDDGGKPYPPRRKRLPPHPSTSPPPFACPLLSDSREVLMVVPRKYRIAIGGIHCAGTYPGHGAYCNQTRNITAEYAEGK